ncbi:MAG: VWA domain-containing protein [Myxococcus sp.]|nr:VWA domain-containing protein [Myxococcus sp.]
MHRSLPAVVSLLSSCLLTVDAGSSARCAITSSSACSEAERQAAGCGAGACPCGPGFSYSSAANLCVPVADGGAAADAGVGPAGLASVMLLVDTSGSMNAPFDMTEPSCGNCSGNTCPPSCPTWVSMTRGAFDQLLQSQPTAAWLGLTTFPDSSAAQFSPAGCAPPTQQAVGLPSPSEPDDLVRVAAQTQQVRAAIATIGGERSVTGGTPTAGALRFVGTAMPASSRPRAVVLVTDGLPNCNPTNPLACDSVPPAPQELCTLGRNCAAQYCRAGYLDGDGSVQAVRELRALGIRSALVVLGTAASDVQPVLNAMADEGGVPACSGASCDQRYFVARNQAQLHAALSAALLRVSQ